MSFECVLEFDGVPPFAAIAGRLANRLLLPREVGEGGLVLAYPTTSEEQLKHWGGDVELEVVEAGLAVTIHGSHHQEILQDILDELRACGFAVSAEEP